MSTINLIEYTPPVVDPKTTRATNVSQMYIISPDTFEHDILYIIGKKSTFAKSYVVKNITFNADLLITIRVPSYIKTSISTVIIKPQQKSTIVVEFDTDAALSQFVSTKQSLSMDQLHWTVTPVNLIGPVYISSSSSRA